MRRVLIDECVNPRLADVLRPAVPDCTVTTVRDLGSAGQKDNKLIQQIQGQFDVFLTLDKGFEFEHHLGKLSFGVIILTTANNQMPSYIRLFDELLREIAAVRAGRVSHVVDPNC